MKEIKFRVWNKISKEYTYYGTPILSLDKKENYPLEFLRPSEQKTKIMLSGYCDLEQFTGLLDTNGKELDWWEGDVLGRSSDGRAEGIIIRDKGCFWLDKIHEKKRIPLYECVDWSLFKIGTIHDRRQNF